MNKNEVRIEQSWANALVEEFSKPYFDELVKFLRKEKNAGKYIYPPGEMIFNAYSLTPIDQVKVVILGQDPYHNPNEAMGLCFSVPKGIRIPPSLRNIYRELQASTDFITPNHGDLTSWAQQGVLLLNSILTVEKNKAASHQSIGWQLFTDATIKVLSEKRENIIFLLWGRYAMGKKTLIDPLKHHILTAAHPSPLARDAFQGCGHFVKANELLNKLKLKKIDWQI